jgi:CheY-like chemotaxis protein
VQLPGMSGLQLQSHLASTGRHIPIIFTAASGDEQSKALARELGAVNLLRKQAGDETLLREIRSIVRPPEND